MEDNHISGGKMNLRRRTVEIIEKSRGDDFAGSVFDISLIALIPLNIAAVTAASFSGFAYAVWLHRFSTVYFLRICTADYKADYKKDYLPTWRKGN